MYKVCMYGLTCVLTSGMTQGIDDWILIQKYSCNISDISIFGLGGGGVLPDGFKKIYPRWFQKSQGSLAHIKTGHGKLYRHDAKEEDEYDSEMELQSERFWAVLYKFELLVSEKVGHLDEHENLWYFHV